MAFANFSCQMEDTGILIIDTQERFESVVFQFDSLLKSMCKLIEGAKILQLPIVALEQYPKGLGPTSAVLQAALGEDQKYFQKTSFSCCGTEEINVYIDSLKRRQWVLAGIEAHVCVLQSAKGLLQQGYQVAVVADGVSSRDAFHSQVALNEMRDVGIRVTTVETILTELIKDSKHSIFKELSKVMKR